MPITCKLIELEEKKYRRNGHMLKQPIDKATKEKPQPGDMFYKPGMLETSPRESFTDRYLAISHTRPPLIVVLPNGQWWCLDQRYYKHPQGYYGDGWTWTGEPPRISVSPSINTSTYHGTLDNGVLSDDLGSHAT